MFKRQVLQLAIGVALTSCAVQPPTPNNRPNSASERHQEKYWSPKPEVYEIQQPSKLDPVMVQTGRYSFLVAKPRIAQLNPLLSVIDVQIPETIVTVKDSAQYLLQFSGYQLTQAISHERHVTALLQHPIPEVHRHFEQVILRDALLALGGSGYPQSALIDKSQLGLSTPNPTTAANALQSGDRVLFFTRLEHCATCKTQLTALVKASQQVNVQLDIYVIGANNDDAIRTWATNQSFDRKRLANKTLTLNHDKGTLTQLAGASATAPLSLLLRGTTTLVLNPSSLP